MAEINPDKSMDYRDYAASAAPATSFTPGQNVNINEDRTFAADPFNIMDDPDQFAEALAAGKIEDVRVEEARAVAQRARRQALAPGGTTMSREPSNIAAVVSPPGSGLQGLDLAVGVLHWKVHHVTMTSEERRQAQALVANILKRHMDDEISGLLHEVPSDPAEDEAGSEEEEVL